MKRLTSSLNCLAIAQRKDNLVQKSFTLIMCVIALLFSALGNMLTNIFIIKGNCNDY